MLLVRRKSFAERPLAKRAENAIRPAVALVGYRARRLARAAQVDLLTRSVVEGERAAEIVAESHGLDAVASGEGDDRGSFDKARKCLALAVDQFDLVDAARYFKEDLDGEGVVDAGGGPFEARAPDLGDEPGVQPVRGTGIAGCREQEEGRRRQDRHDDPQQAEHFRLKFGFRNLRNGVRGTGAAQDG